jgi:hypothetical protein
MRLEAKLIRTHSTTHHLCFNLYGANGYWKYDHMVLQMEDCIDVVKVLWPNFDFLFLFDHSCGHDRCRPNGLNNKSLNKGFGGAQKKIELQRLQQMMRTTLEDMQRNLP